MNALLGLVDVIVIAVTARNIVGIVRGIRRLPAKTQRLLLSAGVTAFLIGAILGTLLT